MSTNSYIAEAATRHSVFLQRYGAGIALDQNPHITELAEDLRNKLLGELTATRRKSLTKIYEQLKTIIEASMKGMNADITDDMNELAVYEADFNLRLLNASTTAATFVAVSPEIVDSIVSTTKMTLTSGQKVTTGTLDDLYKTFSDGTYKEVRRLIRAGIATGETAQEMSNAVYKSVNNRTKAQSKALVLTAANHVGQEALKELSKANSDIIDYERWLSTLDSRTSLICVGLSDRRYQVGEGKYPPAHYRCRSRRVPVVKKQFSIAIDGTRASQFGPVNNQLTYGGFLKNQSKEYQNAVLGEERGKLFRSGKVKVEQFTDDDGRVLTLKQLGELEGITL